MNRRIFLCKPLLFLNNNNIKYVSHIHPPIQTFQSKNKKFESICYFQDNNDNVIFYQTLEWDDIITKSKIKKLKKEVFVLDGRYT
jgi:hypothetical protein